METHIFNCGCCAQHADLVTKQKKTCQRLIIRQKFTSSTDRPLQDKLDIQEIKS